MAGTNAGKHPRYVVQESEEELRRHDGIQLRCPSARARAMATTALQSTLNQKESAPVRIAFIDARDLAGPPPITQLLRGGRGGVVRLKLYLSLLWFGNPAKTLTYPAVAWATLLDLRAPDTNGARRVTAALQWLAQHHFIVLQSRQGHPPDVRLLQDDGSGDPYAVPWDARKEAKRQQGATGVKDQHLYVKLPSTFWTQGWIAVLSGPAVAMFLVLLRLAGKNPGKRVWIAPSEATRRFGLSEDTRTAGVRELAAYGLVSIARRSVDPRSFDWRRVRNVYRLNLSALDSLPGTAPDEDPLQEVGSAHASHSS